MIKKPEKKEDEEREPRFHYYQIGDVVHEVPRLKVQEWVPRHPHAKLIR